MKVVIPANAGTQLQACAGFGPGIRRDDGRSERTKRVANQKNKAEADG